MDIIKLEGIASQVRRDIVRMVSAVNSGHPGGSLGCTDFLTFLYFEAMSHSATPFSMLLLRVEAEYHKKAVGKITFSCNEGNNVQSYINMIFSGNEGRVISMPVMAHNENGDLVADFIFSWSCKNTSSAN